MSLERLETLYDDGTCTPFARHHYDRFWRTSRKNGWKPLELEDFRVLMKHYDSSIRTVLNDGGPSPLLALARKRNCSPFAITVKYDPEAP